MAKRNPPRGTRGASQSPIVQSPIIVKTPKRRALLAGTAFTGAFIAVIVGHPGSALAACQGVGSGNVLCDASNQAAAGALTTTFGGTTVVNVNPGGKIDTGGTTATVTATGDLTFNNNDTTFGITNTAGAGVSLTNSFGATTYLGNANVTATGGNGIQLNPSNSPGDNTITNNATVRSTTNSAIAVGHSGAGNILINGSGDAVGAQLGIAVGQSGTGSITISGSGSAIGGSSSGIAANITGATNGSNIRIDRSGTVSGVDGIAAGTTGTGNITVTGNTAVTATSGRGIVATQSNNAVGTNGSVMVGGSGTVSATDTGIDARVQGANNAGSVAVNRTGSVTASGVGILASTAGSGNATVSGVGDVTSLANTGIKAQALGGGNILIAPAGAVLANNSGIDALASGTGSSTINVSKDISGGNLYGVHSAVSGGINTINVTGGTVSGKLQGILASATTGQTNITVAAGAAVKGLGMLVSGGSANTITNSGTITGSSAINIVGATGTNTITNSGTVAGNTAITTNSGTTTVTNSGSLKADGTIAVQFGGANNLFVMDGPAAALTGMAIGAGTDTFRLSGSGANTFDVSQIGTGWTLLDKTGTSNWTLTGTSTYTGPVTVNGGTLSVNGNLTAASGVTVNNGGTLGGTGTLPSTTINAGGTLAPGNSIGLITISGNLVLGAGAIYRVEVSGASADRTNVAGTATLGASVQVTPLTRLTTRTTYTILAAGTLSSTFASAAVDAGNNFARNPVLSYVGGNVLLTLDPGLLSPFLIAGTPNQRSVAAGIDNAVTAGNPMTGFDPLFGLSAAQLPGALDQLSGEVHASTAGALVDESSYARSAILGRLRQASYGGDASMAALAMGGPQTAFADEALESALAYAKSPIVTKAPVRAPQATSDIVFWSQGFGAWGKFNGDGNAAALSRDLAGFITGFDGRFGNWRGGIAAGYTGSRNNTDRGSANVDTGHIAAYGGVSVGALNLRAGGAYAFHTIDTDRMISFPGFFDRATAHYQGGTGQIFGEAGYGFAFGKLAVEPFAGAAWVRLDTEGFSEKGGVAALNVAANSFEVGYSTLGVRAASLLPLDNGMVLVPRASAAWQHAFGSVTPDAVLAFAAAPANTFTISGVPIARDSLLAEAGLDLALNAHATIGVSYTGQIASNVTDHAAKGKFSWKF